ncbi:hypothetical protein [Methylotenera versatilis]|uniref:hypothetical protein n=1 Tax=Methylotenera versatilis TaxID=1055487 RepID=UPI0006461C36|nr:hypothetical protein [Methylotenera versatilis]
MQRPSKYIVFTLLLTALLAACDKAKEPETEPTAQSPNANSAASLPEKNYTPEVINFEGFGPAKFGDNEESVRMSWGRPLNADKPAVGATCYYLRLDPLPKPQQGIAFMLEDGQFVRYDVDDPKWVAPGNIVVGDTMEKVMQAHAGHVENQPHKYIDGAHTLIVTPTQAGAENKPSSARLIFETDANNIVINWRIGVEPQVYYVEGCN